MAQADAIEASARELISKLPEEIPEEEQEAGKKIIPSSFPICIFIIFPLTF